MGLNVSVAAPELATSAAVQHRGMGLGAGRGEAGRGGLGGAGGREGRGRRPTRDGAGTGSRQGRQDRVAQVNRGNRRRGPGKASESVAGRRSGAAGVLFL